MEKILINKVKEVLYHEVLENGLEVFMVPNNKVSETQISFTTKYGSTNVEFIPRGQKEMKSYPNGIAHFLEHKLFEQKDGTHMLSYYSNNGASANAYTSLYVTSYYFRCTDKLNENLKMLLDFVQDPYFTDENVEKEKGIIKEELLMHEDIPDSYLEEESCALTFINHPIKNNIAGTAKEVDMITKEDLYENYNTFYHPSNMFVVATGNFDPEKIISIIKNNQLRKTFSPASKIIVKEIDEPNMVKKEYEEIKKNVEITKVTVNYKIPISNKKIELSKLMIYSNILIDTLLGQSSFFNERMKEKGYIFSPITYDIINTKQHLFYNIVADTNYPKELVEEIKNSFHNFKMDEEEFLTKKKLFLSLQVYLYDNISAVNHDIVDDIINYQKHDTDIDKLANSLQLNEFNEMVSKFDFTKTSVLIVNPISRKEK